MSAYGEKLKDPRWQKRRLEIMQRDEFYCTRCDDNTKTLHVHHRWYEGEPWDAPDEALVTLCEDCHKEETESWREEGTALLRELARQGFYSSDLNGLMCDVHAMTYTASLGTVLAAVTSVLCDPVVQAAAIALRKARQDEQQARREAARKASA